MLHLPPSARPSSTPAARCSCSGGAGTGKTTVLVERFAWLAGAGLARRRRILALTVGEAAADALRERIEDARSPPPYEELSVTTFRRSARSCCATRRWRPGVDPFATPVAAADRLAMLLERIDELPLRHHDLRGNPSALARRDRRAGSTGSRTS